MVAISRNRTALALGIVTLALACASATPSDPDPIATHAGPDDARAPFIGDAALGSGDDGGAEEDAAPEPDAGPPPMVMPAFLVGYDEAWFGTKFGTDLTTDWDPKYVAATLDGIVAAGGHVVRIFLFELMQGVTLGASQPQTQSVSPAMLANVASVLDMARARGLWVYLTALEGNQSSKVPWLKTYYANLATNTAGEGAAFETHVLGPLLAVLDQHKDNVFGLDLVNELDAPTTDGVWSDPVGGPRAFVQRTRAFVRSKSPWLKVTATVGWDNAPLLLANGFLSGLGLDFYDLHVYSDSGTYSGATGVCNRAQQDGVPVYLGEFGQKSHTYDDNLQKTAAAQFLWTAKSMCFKGALAWRYDTAESWWSYVLPDGGLRPAAAVVRLFGM